VRFCDCAASSHNLPLISASPALRRALLLATEPCLLHSSLSALSTSNGWLADMSRELPCLAATRVRLLSRKCTRPAVENGSKDPNTGSILARLHSAASA
jgi:hypothetical protein